MKHRSEKKTLKLRKNLWISESYCSAKLIKHAKIFEPQ